ncbi:hypothetical protein AKO1_013901 [Acrasis kona]|uniref:CBS domain-containing protein n=1 Tax=Acrasis kona TaxID=1008807 RepID=A0AAW2Z7H3_9EUKA
MTKQISDILKGRSGRKIITLTPNHNLADAVEIMARHNIHHIPIIEADSDKDSPNGRLQGIISDRDLRLHSRSPFDYGPGVRNNNDTMEKAVSDIMNDLNNHTISTIMTKSMVLTLKEDDSIINAIDVMKEADVSAIIITKDKNEIVDIVTRTDIMDVLKSIL